MASKQAKTTDDISAIIKAFLDGSIDAVSASGKLRVDNRRLISYDKVIAVFAADPKYIKLRNNEPINQYQKSHIRKLQELADGRTVKFVLTNFGD